VVARVVAGSGQLRADPPTETDELVDTMVLLLARNSVAQARAGLVARVRSETDPPLTRWGARRSIAAIGRWRMTHLAVALVSLALLAAPLAVAQPARGRAYRVGVLQTTFGENPPTVQGLKAGLRDVGLQAGRDLTLDVRFTRGEIEALSGAAMSLVAAGVDVVVAIGEAPTRAALAATKTVPIVFTGVCDPVAAGLAQSLAHPGGNVTWISSLTTELAPKRLEMLKAIVPDLRRVWAIHHADDPSGRAAAESAEKAGPRVGVEVLVRPVRTNGELVASLKAVRQGEGLLAPYDTILDIPSMMLVASLTGRLLTIYPSGFWVRASVPGAPDVGLGGLAAYGSDYEVEGAQAARLVAKILRGSAPRDLPVEGITSVRLVISLKTAKALGLTIPQSVLLRADEVIQ
jgi:ABC-type uncharacterized transport system substrate-binding protein